MLYIEAAIGADSIPLLSRKLTRVGDAMTDLTPVWPAVQRVVQEYEAKQFAGQGVGPSGAWAALSIPYARAKAAAGYGDSILVRTGALRASVVGVTSDTISEPSRLAFRLGTSVKYAAYHQFGTRHMPRRPIYDLPDDCKRAVVREVQRYLMAKQKAAGL